MQRELRTTAQLELREIRQFHVYSACDYPCCKIEIIHLACADAPLIPNEASRASIVRLDAIPWGELTSEHAQALRDNLDYRAGNRSASILMPKL